MPTLLRSPNIAAPRTNTSMTANSHAAGAIGAAGTAPFSVFFEVPKVLKNFRHETHFDYFVNFK